MNESRLRVVIAAAYPRQPDSPGGGPEAGLAAMLPFLTRYEDLEVHVVTIERGLQSVRIDPTDGAWVHRLPQLCDSQLRNALVSGRRQIGRYVMQLNPDVVHARDTYGLMVQQLDVPRVLSIHGFIHADTRLQGGASSWLRSKIWRWAELRGWSKHPHIISISPYVRERLTGIARGVIHDIDNPVHPDFFEVKRRDEGNRIIFVGSISRLKNPLAIIEAVGRMGGRRTGLAIRLAGRQNPGGYYDLCREAARKYGLEAQTEFLGPLSRQQVLRELSEASVFVLPSLQENAPISLAEAMAAGVPAIASNRCGMPYMIRHGESGFLVDPTDPEDIAGRLAEILNDKGLGNSMSVKSRQIAEERFHPLVVAGRTRKVYLQAAGDRTPARSAGCDAVVRLEQR